MAPKKKSSKGKAAKAPPSAPKPLFPVDESSMVTNHVLLDLQLSNVEMGRKFQERFDVTTPVFMVKRRIVERYGRMASLSLYKDIESADGEITDDRLTLRECGIEGGPGMETPPVFTMFFDYRPFAFDEPVLLAEHRPARDAGRAAAGASSGPASPAGAAP
ncbi:hypothetical protein FNF27_07290 [Cafeteria roenbergensis]|uniref:Ubiquitin-like domain-containing protein n=1 Tax=Cafeteria roenbergensis TaxID=33653 RepID=A0A5A8D9K2_CAFRO|nr:hypothetical protein FNF29_02344 [Cafeteria roenbergensis]KAA0158125.1 hypothetical protein FNF31_05540 [Cafeteria roenbergensis]KAA0160591.1 hypothetical protein FNF28_05389 [Cafeteria roenbergensis]KAA0167624.1 hypothetical protein FNF27_07290 [Cafeteria roenbergensis]|eukprot:KAA0154466.1 hypothetical protein FNF29_02344 [Cafeteria roenbergensis]